MMPVVRISDATWDRLKNHARPFEDSPEDIIKLALDALEGGTPVAVAAEPIKRRRSADKTPQREFREPLMQLLKSMGGAASVGDIRLKLEPLLKSRLKAGDLEPVSNGDPRWWNAVCWERADLVRDGLFHRSSPRGVWELTNKGLSHFN